MVDFDLCDVLLDVVLDGKDMIDFYFEKQIYDVSFIVVVFYYWVCFFMIVYMNYIIYILLLNYIYYCFD